MMNKKATTMSTVILTMIMAMGLFYGMYEFIDTNYQSSNVTALTSYNQSYADIQTRQVELDDNIDAIKEDAQEIAEADGDVITVAWNGLTGLASTIRVFFGSLGISIGLFNALFMPLSFFPVWVNTLVSMGLIIAIILIIIGALKGETKT